MLFGKHVNRYYVKYAPMLLLGMLALIAVDYVQLKIPEYYRLLVNGINGGTVEYGGEIRAFDIDFLLDKICLPIIFIILAMVTGRFLWRICIFGSGIKVEADLRGRMFDHLKDLSNDYYQVNKVGNLMSLFTNDLETIQECFAEGFLMFFDALFLGSLSLVKMARMHPLLTLFCMIPMLLLLLIGILVMKRLRQKWEKRQEAFSALSDFSQESFSGIAVIKAFVKEIKELIEFEKLNKRNEKANVDFTRFSTLLMVSVTLFVESVICVILGYGGYLVHEGVFDAGELVEFIGYFTAIVWPIMAVSSLIEMQSRGRASLKRIGELFKAQPTVVDRPGVVDVDAIRGDIEFKDLSFTYPGASHPSLEHVSFRINAGENVGVIGKTGSGKTTIAELILRIYNVPDGTLLVDGKDVNTIPIKTLRKFAAYVPQDNFLFSDTVANNIALATDNGTREQVIEAAKLSDIDDNIATFENGYDTVLGERGVTVSGGQKQRISIARALMKNAPILILDDAVSAVDVGTEKVILENLRALRSGKTTVLIAHRVSTIEEMDKILFVDDGRVIACGRHEELYKTCPEYKLTVDLQRLEDDKGGEHHA